MTTLFSRLLEGDSLAQLFRFESSGDPRDLARVGRNMILAGQAEREVHERAMLEREGEIESRERALREAEQRAAAREESAEQWESDREKAIRRTAEAAHRNPSNEIGTHDLDTDKGVKAFFNSF